MKFVIASLLLLSGLAHAFEFVPEAAIRTGYGPTQTAWALYYSGVCGERVSVQINFQGRTRLASILPELHSYARGAVKHLQQRCARIETIQVSARGQIASPPAIYLFTMHRSSDWQPADEIWYADLIPSLTTQGYLPFDLTTYRHGLMRIKDKVFEAYYGPFFGNYMRGEQFQQHMMEGTSPPRVSHFTITGNWYEFGNKVENKQCDSTRNGYPYWGSFVFTFESRSRYANLQKNACATEDEKGQGERLQVSEARASDFKRDWGIEQIKTFGVLGEQVTGMNLQAQTHDPASFAKSRKPVFENPQIKIFPRRENWCLRLELDAVYKASNEERDNVFAGSYVRFLSGILWDLVNDNCGKPLVVSIDNYSQGDTENWDRMSFLLDRPNKSGFEPAGEKCVQLTDHFLGDRAKALNADLEARHLGAPCDGSPFCELSGGRYLNAIYRGDVKTVQEIDQQHANELANMMDKTAAAFGVQSDNPISNLLKSKIINSAFVEDVTNKYMYAYSAWGRQCYKPGAEEKTFRYTTPVVVETDPWGVTSRTGGDVYEASYTTNPEFFALRDRLGSHGGAQSSDNPLIRKTKRLVYKGLVAMKQHYSCAGPEVAQFEHNLRQITLAQLNGTNPVNLQQSTNQTSTPQTITPSIARRVPPKAILSSEPDKPATTQLESKQAPHLVVPQTVTPAAKTADVNPVIPAPKLSQAEIYAKRNEEIKALNDTFIAKVNAMNEAFQNDSTRATTNEERLEIMREFQQQISVLRTENREKTAEIQNKYQ